MRAPAESARAEFIKRVDFNEGFHAQFAPQGDQFLQLNIAEHGHNQKKAVGVIGARFPHLPGIEDKILAEHGQGHAFAGIAHIFQRTVEELLFGEDGESGGARVFERLRQGGGVERIAKNAARRRSRLQFGQNVDGIAGERGRKITDGRRGLHAMFQDGFRHDALAVLDPGATGFQDAVQHGSSVGMGRHSDKFVC